MQNILFKISDLIILIQINPIKIITKTNKDVKFYLFIQIIKNKFFSYFCRTCTPFASYAREVQHPSHFLLPSNGMAPVMYPSFSFPRSLNTERLDSSPFLSLYLASLSRLMVDGGARVNAFERQSFRGLRILCRKASWCGILVKCFYGREWSKVVFRFSVGMNGSCVLRSNF